MGDEGSRLLDLLGLNNQRELSREERETALALISNAATSNKPCLVCKAATPNNVDYAIYDLDICAGHATYALSTRK